MPIGLLVGAERHGLRAEDVIVDATLCVEVRDDLESCVDCIHDNYGLFVRLNIRESRGRAPGQQRRGRVVWGYPSLLQAYITFYINIFLLFECIQLFV